jgi:hypothetical protein
MNDFLVKDRYPQYSFTNSLYTAKISENVTLLYNYFPLKKAKIGSEQVCYPLLNSTKFGAFSFLLQYEKIAYEKMVVIESKLPW